MLECLFTLEEMERVRSERGLGMVFRMDQECAKVCILWIPTGLALGVCGLSAFGLLHAAGGSCVRSGWWQTEESGCWGRLLDSESSNGSERSLLAQFPTGISRKSQ